MFASVAAALLIGAAVLLVPDRAETPMDPTPETATQGEAEQEGTPRETTARAAQAEGEDAEENAGADASADAGEDGESERGESTAGRDAEDAPAGDAGREATPAAAPFVPPTPTGAETRQEERNAMVDEQMVDPPRGREAITCERTLEAMRAVPRHALVPARLRVRAYEDTPLPIGHGQTISQPWIVARMTELLGIDETSRVLEIGTGSGYQAAVLAHITPHVYSVEIIRALYERAAADLAEQGYDGIQLKHGDGYHGWAEHAPFDAIIVTAAAGHLPPPLWEQLRPGGRIVAPIGSPQATQRLLVITKHEDGSRTSETVGMVRFVPFTRADD